MNYLLLAPENIIQKPAHETTSASTTITDVEQVRHFKNVLNVNVGDSVKVAVLQGKLGSAVVKSIDKNSIQLSNIQANTAPPQKLPITLILALPRPKALRRLIMDAVAMGIQEIYLINSYRVEKSYWQSPHLQRIREYMLLGLAQAGDTVLPTIHVKKRFKPFVEDELASIIAQRKAYVAHPQVYQPLAENLPKPQQEVVLVIGAEGGFIPYEVDLLSQHGCEPVKIYNRILRTETAVSVLVGQLLQSIM